MGHYNDEAPFDAKVKVSEYRARAKDMEAKGQKEMAKAILQEGAWVLECRGALREARELWLEVGDPGVVVGRGVSREWLEEDGGENVR